MRGKMKRLLICTFLFCITLPLFAISVDEVLDKDTAAELRKNGKIEVLHYMENNFQLKKSPETELNVLARKNWPNQKDKPVYIAEELYLLNKKDLGKGDFSTTNIPYISKLVRSVSKMEGMKYYSHTNKKVMTLYKECYRIESATGKTKLPDDLEGSADGKVYYCMQNDESFGKTNYRLEYKQTENEVSASFTNVSPLWVGIIKGIDTENMNISLVVTDCGEELLVYMLVQSRFPALAILEKTMNDSFGSRLDAIYKWFINQF